MYLFGCLALHVHKKPTTFSNSIAGVDPEANVFAKSRDRPTNPAAQDIYNAPSLGQLIEQPIGLAYITSTPCFEINGPIRFKRSVSGNRYKAPTNEPGTGWINQQPHLHGNGPDIPRPPLPPSQPGSSPGKPCHERLSDGESWKGFCRRTPNVLDKSADHIQ